MKTLVLDQGNSTLFAGVFRGDKLMRSVRITKNVSAEINRLARGKVDRVALCSVVPKETSRLVTLLKKRLGLDPMMLTSTADHGLHVAYEQPKKLGLDRLANALGARKLYPRKNVIVVDCGSATTLTLLHRDGTLLGGSILPGLAMWSEILNQRTARLPSVSLSAPNVVVGRDTDAAIRSGIMHGHAGAIRELISKSRRESFGRSPVVVLGTGGQVTHFKQQSLFTHIESELILHGLQAFASRLTTHA
jgi:type III pantothenate kinase